MQQEAVVQKRLPEKCKIKKASWLIVFVMNDQKEKETFLLVGFCHTIRRRLRRTRVRSHRYAAKGKRNILIVGCCINIRVMNLHPGFGVGDGVEVKLPVQIVRIARGQ